MGAASRLPPRSHFRMIPRFCAARATRECAASNHRRSWIPDRLPTAPHSSLPDHVEAAPAPIPARDTPRNELTAPRAPHGRGCRPGRSPNHSPRSPEPAPGLLYVRPYPLGHRRRHALPRAIGPGVAEALKSLLDDVENLPVPHAQHALQAHEVLARDLGEPSCSEERQPELGIAWSGQVDGCAHEVVGGREPGPFAVGVDEGQFLRWASPLPTSRLKTVRRTISRSEARSCPR